MHRPDVVRARVLAALRRLPLGQYIPGGHRGRHSGGGIGAGRGHVPAGPAAADPETGVPAQQQPLRGHSAHLGQPAAARTALGVAERVPRDPGHLAGDRVDDRAGCASVGDEDPGAGAGDGRRGGPRDLDPLPGAVRHVVQIERDKGAGRVQRVLARRTEGPGHEVLPAVLGDGEQPGELVRGGRRMPGRPGPPRPAGRGVESAQPEPGLLDPLQIGDTAAVLRDGVLGRDVGDLPALPGVVRGGDGEPGQRAGAVPHGLAGLVAGGLARALTSAAHAQQDQQRQDDQPGHQGHANDPLSHGPPVSGAARSVCGDGRQGSNCLCAPSSSISSLFRAGALPAAGDDGGKGTGTAGMPRISR